MTIYLDGTNTILRWKGVPSGIQRAILGLANATTEKGVMLVTLVPKAGRWYAVDPHSIFLAAPGKPFLGGLRRFVRASRQNVPRFLAPFLLPLFWPFYRLAVLCVEFVERRNIARQKEVMARGSPIAWHSGDALFVIDTNWTISAYADALSALRRSVPDLKVVGFFYDLIPLLAPQFVSRESAAVFAAFAPKLLTLSTHIATDSAYVAKTVLECFRGTFGESGVTYRLADGTSVTHAQPPRAVRFGNKIDLARAGPLAASTAELIDDLENGRKLISASQAATMRAQESWLICVGYIEARKNLDTQINALRPLWESGRLSLPLILVGRVGLGATDLIYRMKTDPILAQHVIILEALDDRTTWSLWRLARACIVSSWYEGYGLPISESLQLGCPVIAADATALPEVAGSLIDYFPPWDTRALQKLVLKLCDPQSEHRRMRLEQLTRFRPTDWSEMLASLRYVIEPAPSPAAAEAPLRLDGSGAAHGRRTAPMARRW